MAKTKVKIDLKKLGKISEASVAALNANKSERFDGEFTMIREAKSGSVQIALTSWDSDADSAVEELRKVGDEQLLFHVSRLEYDALVEAGMTSEFFIRKSENTGNLYIGLDNETSNTRKELGISVAGMTKLNKKAPTSKYALEMIRQVSLAKAGQINNVVGQSLVNNLNSEAVLAN